MSACADTCERVCFYCDAPLSPRHEHDHFPTPKRYGGNDVVPTCLNCHDLKDRLPLRDWDLTLWADAWKSAGPLGRILIAKSANAARDSGAAADELRAELEALRAPAA